jgi:diguanylate cyclase (GGDEF)-like protein
MTVLLPRYPAILLPLFYLFFFCALFLSGYHALAGTASGESMAPMAAVLLILPVFILDRPCRVGGLVICFNTLFLITAYRLLPGRPAGNLSIGCVIFSVLGLFLGRSAGVRKLNDLELRRQTALQRDHDALTLLPNRRKLFETFSTLERVTCPPHIGILMLDVDNFKLYNDCCGHQKGDDCLRQLGACFARFAQEQGTEIFRFGGEEFLMLSLKYSYQELGVLAQALADRVRQLGIPHPTWSCGVVTVSAGYAESSVCGCSDFDDLISRADTALYCAKRAGRARVTGCLDTGDAPECPPVTRRRT